jgi:hypothetical protein
VERYYLTGGGIAKQLSSGGVHSPGFVRIFKRIQPMNSSAWEKDLRLESLNKAVSPLLARRYNS